MNQSNISRRQLLSTIGLTAAVGGLTGAFPAAAADNEKSDRSFLALNVRDFGAAGDGKKDDTAAFAAAMKAASESGNYTVFIPRGHYRIEGNLNVPPHVTLEGVLNSAPTSRDSHDGSVLQAFAGAGSAEGKPFITLNASCTLRGLTVYYPEQKMVNPPVAYPWTIHGQGDNISLIDILLVNPYQGVDFGTSPAGRHFINGLYGQPLFRGLFVDQCYDVGRIQNVHFWSFWGGWEGPVYEFMRTHAIAFVMAKTDWEFMSNCFCIGYKTGYHFTANQAGPGNCLLTECGSDISPNAVRVESSQGHAGISFVNCQFMAGIEIGPANTGPVKFTACGFWGIPTTDHHAMLEGSGQTIFNSCHFIGWGQKDVNAPCIHAKNGGLTVTACDFMDQGKAQITVETGVDAAIIYGNRLRKEERIINHAGSAAQIGMNVVSKK